MGAAPAFVRTGVVCSVVKIKVSPEKKTTLTPAQQALAQKLMGMARTVASRFAVTDDEYDEFTQVGCEVICNNLSTLPADKWISWNLMRKAVRKAVFKAASRQHTTLESDPACHRDQSASLDIDDAINQLPPLERAVIVSRFGLGESRVESLAEVARRLGVSVAVIRVCYESALARLRELRVLIE